MKKKKRGSERTKYRKYKSTNFFSSNGINLVLKEIHLGRYMVILKKGGRN